MRFSALADGSVAPGGGLSDGELAGIQALLNGVDAALGVLKGLMSNDRTGEAWLLATEELEKLVPPGVRDMVTQSADLLTKVLDLREQVLAARATRDAMPQKGGATAGSSAARTAEIATLRAQYNDERLTGRMILNSEADFVSGSLLSVSHPRLTPAEIECHGLATNLPRRGDTPRTVSSGSVERRRLVAAARVTYARERDLGAVTLCGEGAWVNRALRDAQQSQLSGAEFSALEIAADAVVDRRGLIAGARHSFAAERAGGKTVLCCEAAWVNNALREVGLARMTADEQVSLGIVAD
jgi:hypothetical protein